MKKIFIYLAATAASALIFTSCNKEDAISVPHNGSISFRTNLDYAKTRGAEVSTESLNKPGQKFTVWGEQQEAGGANLMLMDNVEVEYQAPGIFKNSDRDYFWPANGESMKFWAVQNNYSGTTTVNGVTNKIAGFKPAAVHTADEAMTDLQKDLVMAYGIGNKADNEASGMALLFQHALSQIEFQAVNDPSLSSWDVYVAGVAIYNLDGIADVTFPASPADLPTWSSNDDNTDAFYQNIGSAHSVKVDANPTAITQGKGAGSNFMLIPQRVKGYHKTASGDYSGTYARLFICVVDRASGKVIYPKGATTSSMKFGSADVALPDVEWKPGMKYVYKLDFSQGFGNLPFEPKPTPVPNPGVDPVPVIDPIITPTPEPTPISGKPIHFTVTVKEWTVGTMQTVSM